ncbi:MAG: hypothetical protein NTW86_01320 [Candidatus Sumerlaeota bacterium]|nr:hypothetical protein [Candidatus Sumerlaeota bacterium]
MRKPSTSCLLISAVFVLLVSCCSAANLRIATASLKQFGDSKAQNQASLHFIARQIADEAVHGVCVVDELQDADGSAIEILKQAVVRAAGEPVDLKLSKRVGTTKKEQF